MSISSLSGSGPVIRVKSASCHRITCQPRGSLASFPLPQAGLRRYTETVNSYYHFIIPSVEATLGYVVPSVARAFRDQEGWVIDEEATPKTLALVGGDDEASRTALVAKALSNFRTEKRFGILSRWHDELKPVYGPGGRMVLAIERAAAPLLGVVNYGMQLSVFTRPVDGGEPRVWVQKRSENVKFYPGLLDNAASEVMPIDREPLEAAIRCAAEQTSLSEDLIRASIKPCGTVSYMHQHGSRILRETGLLQPQFDQLFELELPADVEPGPPGVEVECFELHDVNQIRTELSEGL